MTCIAACKIDGKVFIGSDSQTNSSGVKDNNMRKITKFPHYMIGIAGDYAIHKFLEDASKDPSWESPPIQSETMARGLAKRILQAYKADGEGNPDDDDATGPEVMFIITTPTAIYEVDGYLLVHERESFSSVGTGAPYAKAAMQVMLEEKITNDGIELLNKALRIAAANDLYSGLPVYVFEVKENLPPKRRPKK